MSVRVAILAIVALACAAAWADENVPIENASFEASAAPDQSPYYSGLGANATLFTTSGVQVATVSTPGWWGAGAGVLYNWRTLPAARGRNAAFSGNTGRGEQTLATTFQPASTYVLMAQVGWRPGEPAPVPVLNLYWKDSYYHLVRPTASSSPPLQQGSWVLWSRTYVLDSQADAVDKAIVVLFSCAGGTMACFDGIVLTNITSHVP